MKNFYISLHSLCGSSVECTTIRHIFGPYASRKEAQKEQYRLFDMFGLMNIENHYMPSVFELDTSNITSAPSEQEDMRKLLGMNEDW